MFKLKWRNTMKNGILMTILLLLTPLVSLPMSFLTNNSLTNKLAFLSRMRFTKPTTTTTRPYFSKHINVMKTNRDEETKEVTSTKAILVDFHKNTDIPMPERIKKTQKTVEDIQCSEKIINNMQNHINEFSDFNKEFNDIYADYVKSLESSNFEKAKELALELEKKYATANKLKEFLRNQQCYIQTKRDNNGFIESRNYYQFDEE